MVVSIERPKTRDQWSELFKEYFLRALSRIFLSNTPSHVSRVHTSWPQNFILICPCTYQTMCLIEILQYQVWWFSTSVSVLGSWNYRVTQREVGQNDKAPSPASDRKGLNRICVPAKKQRNKGRKKAIYLAMFSHDCELNLVLSKTSLNGTYNKLSKTMIKWINNW